MVFFISDFLYNLRCTTDMDILFKHKTIVQTSPLMEAMLLIRAICDDSARKDPLLIEPFLSYADRFSNAVSFLKENTYLTLGFSELMLVIPERNSVKMFFEQLDKITDDRKLYYLLGCYFPIDEIREFMDNPSIFTKKTASLPLSLSESSVIIFSDFDEFKNNYYELLESLCGDSLFLKILNEHSIEAEEESAIISRNLKNRHPLSYAQELMGKSFWNIADWAEHEFIPSIFSSPGSFRLMDSQKQIVVTPVRKKNDSQENGDALTGKLKLLSDSKRMEILKMTYAKPMYGKQIADALNLTTATVSHHLDVLHRAGLLNLERDRHIKYFSSNLRNIRKLMNEIENYIKK